MPRPPSRRGFLATWPGRASPRIGIAYLQARHAYVLQRIAYTLQQLRPSSCVLGFMLF